MLAMSKQPTEPTPESPAQLGAEEILHAIANGMLRFPSAPTWRLQSDPPTITLSIPIIGETADETAIIKAIGPRPGSVVRGTHPGAESATPEVSGDWWVFRWATAAPADGKRS